ncbi:MAG TPA: glycine-rich domain-containing protein-like [Longimicrobium sp.]|jgi:hypothetical protein
MSTGAINHTRPVTISVDLVVASRRVEDGFFSGCSPREIVESADRYKKFLTLIQRYPEAIIAPTRDIDEMWHLHMLHPVAYYHDCMSSFGEIIDHDGGFGSEPEEAPVLAATFRYTSELWQQEYGESYASNDEGSVKCTRNCVSRCKRACKTN